MVVHSRAAEPLPNTKPLTEEGDLAAKMVAGIHKYLDREIAASAKLRETTFKGDKAARERFKRMLGLVDARLPARMEYISGPGEPAVIAECEALKAYAVRWNVLPGVDGEGLLLEPKGKVIANVVAIPDATWTPEQIAGLTKDAKWPKPFAKRLAEHGCRVVIPVLIDRNDNLSGNPKLGRSTNIPHREFIDRMAYEMGRTLVGYEVQKVLSAVDWFQSRDKNIPIGAIGVGDGGRIALYAGAADERIKAAHIACAFGPREAMYDEPIDRNFWGALREFGDAEVASLVAEQYRELPRVSVYPPSEKTKVPEGAWPVWGGPAAPKAGKSGAAPGTIKAIPAADVVNEYKRYLALLPTTGRIFGGVEADDDWYGWRALLQNFGSGFAPQEKPTHDIADKRKGFDPAARHKRQFDQLVAYTQKLWRNSDAVRKQFWAKADTKSLEAYERSTEWYRDYFHTEVIGKLPEPTMPLNPRSRPMYDEPKWTGHEVMLDVYPDVFAYGILLLPKGMKEGEKRPVVVCQHGLEGRPTDVTNPKKKTPYYNSFAAQLADLGYIVYAPQNPYIGQTTFRQIQRKAQPLKLALFSFIVRQHQRTIDWLETLSNVDTRRIAFYGLSYGGKTAMRVPAIEKRYCLSICSADFNEWVGKCVSVDLDRSYMWTIEYDMYEFDLGNTFNYAEMAFLIAPRPFMVERGHDDGVGIDEMVAYEYAKIRYLYANKLKIPDRTAIEFFAGGHEIRGQGTFAFLKKHLAFPK